MVAKSELEIKIHNYENLLKRIIGALHNIDFNIFLESRTNKKLLEYHFVKKNDISLINDLQQYINDFVARNIQKPLKEKSHLNILKLFSKKISNFENEKDNYHFKVIKQIQRLDSDAYPGVKILDNKSRITYLETKLIINKKDFEPPNFHFPPLTNSKKKITDDARHLLLCFDIDEIEEKHFLITGWCLIDLFGVKVTMKPEFNTNNLELYKQEHIIYEQTFN